nr:MAG TPA: hypothetical protein [Caudoviricetes sp.]
MILYILYSLAFHHLHKTFFEKFLISLLTTCENASIMKP